jgi:hypothetical protein
MIWLGIIIGVVGLLVLEAVGAIVIYVLWLRASVQPNAPARYTIVPSRRDPR